jgi:hypothetical protein
MKGTVTGRDVLSELEKCVDQWSRWIRLVKAGFSCNRWCTCNVFQEKVRLVGLLKAQLKENYGVNMTSIHWLIQQEALCGKKLIVENVIKNLAKTVNFLRSRSLNHRQFTAFLFMIESEYGELLYHTEVRWPSRGNMLKQFLSLEGGNRTFHGYEEQWCPWVSNPKFIANLTFLTDLTDHLNTLNLRLQGHKHVITVMYDCAKSFKCELTLWTEQLEQQW